MNNISQLIYDSYKGQIPEKYAKLDKKVREDKIREKIYEALNMEYSETFNKKAFRQNFRDNKTKVFRIIEDIADQVMLDGEYQKNSFFNEFVEIKNLALGDKNEFYVDVKNQLEVTEFSGSHWDLKRRRVDVGQKFSVEMRDFGIKIYEEFERIMSGRADFAKLVEYIIEAVDRKISEFGYAIFAQAIQNLPAEFSHSGDYDKGKILKVLAHVEASTGVKPTLVGTSFALSQLQDMTIKTMSNEMMNEKNNNGILKVWNGYTCLELAQGHQIGSFKFTMSENDIYVLTGGDKLVKLCLEGETLVKETNDGTTNADMTSEYTLQFKMGGAVAYSNMVGLIQLPTE